MQVNAIFAIFLVFVGVCMIESFKGTEEKCPCPLKDRQLFVDCVNKTKNGDCDFAAFMDDPINFLNETEKRQVAMCIAEGKNVLTKDGQIDDAAMYDAIKKMNATEETKGDLKKAFDECRLAKKNSVDPTADTFICSSEKAMKICSSDSTKKNA